MVKYMQMDLSLIMNDIKYIIYKPDGFQLKTG